MKKLLALLLALVMVLSLAACGKDEPVKDDNDKKTTSQSGDKDSGEEKDPVGSHGSEVENLMSHPESPEEDFVCEDYGDGVWTLTQYLGDDEIVVIPETVNGKNVEAIGSHVFALSSPVKAVKLPDTVYKLMGSTFAANENLEIVIFGSGMREIGAADGTFIGGTFHNCTNLREVVLNDGLERIGPVAFAVCENLVSLEIPASVTEIDHMAFYAQPESFTIVGEAGSYAEQYAKENNITFQAK